MPTIRIPTPLRPFTGGATEVAITGATVAEAMRDLTAQHPQLQQHLYGADGELRSFVNIFLDSEDVRHLQGIATPLQAGARLRIVPSVAGGNRSQHEAKQLASPYSWAQYCPGTSDKIFCNRCGMSVALSTRNKI